MSESIHHQSGFHVLQLGQFSKQTSGRIRTRSQQQSHLDGTTRTLWAMMDTRCRDGWRLNSTMSPSCKCLSTMSPICPKRTSVTNWTSDGV